MSETEVAQMLYRCLLAYRHAQRKMLDQYAESSQEKCNQLWRDLHACEADADEAIDAADEFFGGQGKDGE